VKLSTGFDRRVSRLINTLEDRPGTSTSTAASLVASSRARPGGRKDAPEKAEPHGENRMFQSGKPHQRRKFPPGKTPTRTIAIKPRLFSISRKGRAVGPVGNRFLNSAINSDRRSASRNGFLVPQFASLYHRRRAIRVWPQCEPFCSRLSQPASPIPDRVRRMRADEREWLDGGFRTASRLGAPPFLEHRIRTRPL
jgi:hypothetical protein